MIIKRKVPRNSIVHALIIQGNISRMTGKIIPPKRGKGAKYNRQKNKKVEGLY